MKVHLHKHSTFLFHFTVLKYFIYSKDMNVKLGFYSEHGLIIFLSVYLQDIGDVGSLRMVHFGLL